MCGSPRFATVLNVRRLLRELVVERLRACVIHFRVPVDARRAVFIRSSKDGLDQRASDAQSACGLSDEQIFQITVAFSGPGRDVEKIMNESHDAPFMQRRESIGLLDRRDQTLPCRLRDLLGQLFLIERQIAIP